MKKTAVVVIAILCMVLAIGLTACNSSGELLAPGNVAISGNTLSWDEVKNASGYVVKIDEGTEAEALVETDNTFYTHKTNVHGRHTMSVQAKGEGKFTSSAFTAPLEFYVTDVLVAPTIKIAEITDAKVVYEWNAVEHAKSYAIKIGLESTNSVEAIAVEGTTFEIDRTLDIYDDIGVYLASVVAISGDPNYRDSADSNKIPYINSEKLGVPGEFKCEDGVFKWTKPSDNVTMYKVTAKDNAGKVVGTKDTERLSVRYDDFDITKAGTYTVNVVAYNDKRPNVYLESDATADISFTILPEVTEFKLNPDTGVLSWKAINEASSYTINATTLNGRSEVLTVDKDDAMNTSGTYTLDLKTKDVFKTSNNAYSLFTFNIVAKGNSAENVFASKEVALEKGVFYEYKPVEGDIQESEKANIFPEKVTVEGENPYSYYKVTNFAQLMYALENYSDAEIRLANNIDIKYTEFLSPMKGVFNGVFDGNGYSIYGIKMSPKFNRDNMSIFGVIGSKGVVRNVNIPDADIKFEGTNEISGLIANTNNGKIENVVVKASIVADGDRDVAGIVGVNNGTISSSFVIKKDTIQGRRVGGIAVQNGTLGVIKNCTVDAELMGLTTSKLAREAVVGGIAAINDGNITYSISRAKVNAETGDSYGIVGGVVGINNGKIDYTYYANAKANITSNSTKSYLGGFVGENANNGIIEYSYVDQSASIDRSTTSPYAGGFAGHNAGTINNAFSSASINKTNAGNEHIAAFIGKNDSANVNNITFNMGNSGAEKSKAIAEGTALNAETCKGFYFNTDIDKAIAILGSEFGYKYGAHIIDNKIMPRLNKVIYVEAEATIVKASVDTDWATNKDLNKYYFNGEVKTVAEVAGEHKINSHAGYQIIEYREGDIVMNRLVEVK